MFHSTLLPSNNFQSYGNSRVLHFMRAKKWCIWYQPHRVGEVVVIKKNTFHRSDLVPRTCCDPTICYGDLWSVRPSTASTSFASRHPHLHAPSWLAWWRPSFSWRLACLTFEDTINIHQHSLHAGILQNQHNNRVSGPQAQVSLLTPLLYSEMGLF